MKLKFKALKAAQMYVATNDVRQYLKGVHVNAEKIEATNGHFIFVYDQTHEVQQEDFDFFDVIVPTASVKKFVANVDAIIKAESLNPLTVEVDLTYLEGNQYQLKYEDCVETFTTIGGRFPDMARVTPRLKCEQTVTEICLDLDYLAIVAKTTKILTSQKNADPVIHFFGSNMSVRFVWGCDANAIVVLMPKRV